AGEEIERRDRPRVLGRLSSVRSVERGRTSAVRGPARAIERKSGIEGDRPIERGDRSLPNHSERPLVASLREIEGSEEQENDEGTGARHRVLDPSGLPRASGERRTGGDRRGDRQGGHRPGTG